jgi:peptide deformylase
VSVRPIVLLGDPRLRIKGQPVESFGRFLHGLLDDLAHTMRAAPGVGLAAPQIGEALAVCVVEIEDRLHERGHEPGTPAPLDQLDALWEAAKREEQAGWP